MKSLLLLLTAISLCVQSSFSQDLPGQKIELPDAQYNAHIDEVYGPHFFDQKPELKTRFVELLRDRVSYVYEPVTADTKPYPSVSSVGLRTDENPNVQAHDPAQFSTSTFNPLIYNWHPFYHEIQVYRIDGTDYVLVIQPQIIKQ